MFNQAAKFLSTTTAVLLFVGMAWFALPGTASAATDCDDLADPCQVRQHMHGDGSFENRETDFENRFGDLVNLINLYTFEEGVGIAAGDAFNPYYNLRINTAAVRWYENSTGMQITENDETWALQGDIGAHRELFDGLNAWSIEMWIVLDRDPDFTEG